MGRFSVYNAGWRIFMAVLRQIVPGFSVGRRCFTVVAALLLVACVFACAGTARAQSSSPISPYLMLTQRNRGALNNYQAYVQPQLRQQQMAKAMQTQNAVLQRTQSATREIEDALGDEEGLLSAPKKRAGGSGAAAGFRNHSHWYQGISQDPTPRNQRKFR